MLREAPGSSQRDEWQGESLRRLLTLPHSHVPFSLSVYSSISGYCYTMMFIYDCRSVLRGLFITWVMSTTLKPNTWAIWVSQRSSIQSPRPLPAVTELSLCNALSHRITWPWRFPRACQRRSAEGCRLLHGQPWHSERTQRQGGWGPRGW